MTKQVIFRNIPRVKKSEMISPISEPVQPAPVVPAQPIAAPVAAAPAAASIDTGNAMKLVTSLVKEVIDVTTSIKLLEAELDNLRYEASASVQQAYIVAPRIIKALKVLGEAHQHIEAIEGNVDTLKKAIRGELDEAQPAQPAAAPVATASEDDDDKKAKKSVKHNLPESPLAKLKV